MGVSAQRKNEAAEAVSENLQIQTGIKRRFLPDPCQMDLDQEVNQLMDRLHKEGKKLAIWGASHQGFTLAATTRLGNKVEYMMDSAPFKQGRFAPASHIPIVAPDEFFANPVDAGSYCGAWLYG